MAIQPDSLLPQVHLVMFQSDTLQGQTDLEHELYKTCADVLPVFFVSSMEQNDFKPASVHLVLLLWQTATVRVLRLCCT